MFNPKQHVTSSIMTDKILALLKKHNQNNLLQILSELQAAEQEALQTELAKWNLVGMCTTFKQTIDRVSQKLQQFECNLKPLCDSQVKDSTRLLPEELQ